MRRLDARTIEEAGIPGSLLMENAGVGAGELILEFAANLAENHVRRFVLLAGKGNNGGDAYVAAKYLWEHSEVPVVLHSVCPLEELKGDASHHAGLLPAEVGFSLDPPSFEAGDIIVDGLLGTGASGPLRAPYDDWVARINASNLPVVALDIPTGLDGDDGSVADDAVLADLSITMGLPKQGMLLNRGPELCGSLRVVDIGVPKEFMEDMDSEMEITEFEDVRSFLGRRPPFSHKKSAGHVLVVGGSSDYPGAPVLSAEAALRSGAGLVTLAVPRGAEVPPPDSRSIIFRRVDDGGKGVFSEESIPALNKLAGIADSLVIGPGMTAAKSVEPVLEALLLYDKPMALDADALNLIAGNPELITSISTPNIVLTPHPGEAKRLLKAFSLPPVSDDRDSIARIAAAANIAAVSGCVAILKGHRSVVASSSGEILVNSSGSSALSTAGTGDVLAGLVAALLAGDGEPLNAAAAAAFIHGLAGEMSPRGIRGFTADDLVEMIPEAMRRISPFA
jgi:NAD(P)H-hydrate epimerase